MGTLNCLLQKVQTPIAGIMRTHLTTLRLRFGMSTVSHRRETTASPADFKLRHGRALL